MSGTQPQRIFRHWAWVVLVLLVMTALATPRLGESIWADEYRTYWYTGGDPIFGPATYGDLLDRIALNRFQAPLYYLLTATWAKLVGWGDVPLRALSLYFGLLAVALLYHITRRQFSASVAFYAALTCGVSAFYVNYLHEMRTYTQLILLVLVMIWSYSKVIAGRGRYGYAVVLGLSVSGALYSHYYAVFPAAVLGLYLLAFGRRQPGFWLALGAIFLGGLAFLPWLRVFLEGAIQTTSDDRQSDNMDPLLLVWNVLYDFSSGSVALTAFLLVLAARTRQPNTRFLWFWLVVGIVLVLAIAPFFLINEVRYLLFLWPALAVLAALGLVHLSRDRLTAVTLVVIWTLLAVRGVLSEAEQARIHPWYISPLRETAVALRPYVLPDDWVLHIAPENLQGPRREVVEFYMAPYHANGDMLLDQFTTTEAEYLINLEELTRGQPRLWTVYDPDRRNWRVGPLENWFLPDLGYALCGPLPNRQGLNLAYWTNADALPGDATTFTNPEGEVLRAGLLWPIEPHGGTLPYNVIWTATDDAPVYSLALHIEDAAGAFVQGIDIGMTPIVHGCELGMADLRGLPNGDYTVKLTVYNWETGERLSPADVTTPDNRVTVGTFAR